MTRTLRIVFGREVKDNFRDRRTLISALLMGPLFGPILFAFVINMSLERALTDRQEALELPTIGAERAPNLVEYLRGQGVDVVAGPPSREAAIVAVEQGVHDVVMIIPESFPGQFTTAVPARIELVSDQANTTAEREARRAARALSAWSQEIAGMRLLVRGVDPGLLRPINIDEVDVSTPSGRSAILLGMLSYFFIFALLTGGMNLAIDATAGERERGSLEPLLSLPVTRDQLIYGKILAACLFMALSLSLSLVSFHATLKFLPLEQLGMTPNFGPAVVVASFFLLVPFALLGAALMTLVASFTRSYKEAQTWLSAVLLAPTLPIIVVSILQVRPSTELMLVPSLSQHLLLNGLIRNEPVNVLHASVSVVSTIALGVLLTYVCARLYRREGLLG